MSAGTWCAVCEMLSQGCYVNRDGSVVCKVCEHTIGRWRAVSTTADGGMLFEAIERLPTHAGNRQQAPQQNPPADKIRPVPRFRPFPLDVLPEVLARFIGETAGALGCDPTFVALPMLCTTAAAIGTTRAIELKSSWIEHAILWAGVVARSGTLKSPAFDAATAPLRRAQTDALRDYEAEREAHERAMLQCERDVARWRRSKTDTQPPAKPECPTARRFVVSDTTLEALAPILETNPRGLLLARDELAAWIGGFDQYRSRGRGGDAAAWLELWRAGALIIDRKTGDKRTVHVPRAAVSVCGTIQPGTLASVLTSEHFENGLAARLLLAQPPELIKRWSDRTPSAAAVGGYEDLIRTLLTREHVHGERGPEPTLLPLAADARPLWTAWYDQHAQRIAEADDDPQAAALAKIEGYAARFALIFALATDPRACMVSADAVQRGIALADWFAAETVRFYGIMAESDEGRELRRMVELVERKGNSVSVREWQRARSHGTADDAEGELQKLVEAGFGQWTYSPQVGRGRPSKRFVLISDTPDTDEIPDSEPSDAFLSVSERSGGLGDVSDVGCADGE